tara:strand:+ start:90 stop:290 length:201 start_codon:yes stop_codon:yes gene_type:complete
MRRDETQKRAAHVTSRRRGRRERERKKKREKEREGGTKRESLCTQVRTLSKLPWSTPMDLAGVDAA